MFILDCRKIHPIRFSVRKRWVALRILGGEGRLGTWQGSLRLDSRVQ